jgi:hypothetical protein
MCLGFLKPKLSRDECELWHLLAGFLPHGGLVKFRQILQLWLGEFLGIGGDRVLLVTPQLTVVPAPSLNEAFERM